MSKSIMQPTAKCIDLSAYRKLGTIKDKADWLKIFGKTVCEDILFDSMLKDHKITTTVTRNPHMKAYTIAWSLMNKEIAGIQDFESYLCITTDKDGVTGFVIVKDYNPSETCYSIPFLRSITKACKTGSSDIITIMYAEFEGEAAIVFELTDNNSGKPVFYDFSNEPKLIQSENRPL